jgi:putative SOS response-associated peptidase YedK
MPVILHPADYDLWLGADTHELDLVRQILRPYPDEEMMSYPVGPSVNSPCNQGAGLIKRAAVNSA